MERFEVFSNLKVIPDIPFVTRLDGRCFHQLAESLALVRPFDQTFRKCLSQATKALFETSGLNPVFAFLFSDEVNLLFLNDPFARRVEKICSITAGFLSVAFSQHLTRMFEHPEVAFGVFDARIIPLPTIDHLIEYFIQKQHDAFRNCVNSYAFYALVQQYGLTPIEADTHLNRMTKQKRMDLLFKEFKVNINDVPMWERRGWSIYRDYFKKPGFNPLTGERTTTLRTKIKIDLNLPLFNSEAGKTFLQIWIQSES
ncbi:MAG: tRNA(His) guanylyltransferase Thg1 family protein [Candidatus Heimdallarchaeota archaeon]